MKMKFLYDALNKKLFVKFIIVTMSVGFFYAYPITFTQKIVNELGGGRNEEKILIFIVSYMICRICGCTFDYIGAVLSKSISNEISINLKRFFLHHYYEVSPDFIFHEKIEKTYALYSNDVSIIASGVCGPVLWFLSSVSLFLWSSFTLVSIRWELAVVYIISALIIVYTTVKSGKIVRRIQSDIREAEEKRIHWSKIVIEQYMKLRIMKYERKVVEENMNAEDVYNNLCLSESKISARKTMINDVVYYLAGAVVWFIGSILIIINDMTIGELVAFISFSGLIISPIVRFSSQWISLQKMRVSLNRIGDFLNLPIANGGREINLKQNYALTLSNVSFSYNADKTMLKNLTYHFDVGNVYCIIGENGSGKSTLFKLICRMINDYSGEIQLGDEDIREFSRSSLYEAISYENEYPLIISGSLLENLTLGISSPRMEEVRYLCERVGLASSLGERYELEAFLEEKKLSHGQKQLIGIIRNLLSHKKVMILDESFSGIASDLVYIIMEIYKEYCKNDLSIMLYVSHSEEYQKLADKQLYI